MKKFFNNTTAPVILCVCSIIVLAAMLVFLIFFYAQSRSNLAIQQQWTSDKNSFDKAYEIAASDKETPDKNLYIPNLVEQIGKTIDQMIAAVGNGATIVSTTPVNGPNGAKQEYLINLTNESADMSSGSTHINAAVDSKGKIISISFACNTKLLGYGSYSFVDMIDNQHIIENSLREAGLNVDDGVVKAPSDRMSFTTYLADGVTIAKESYDFSGNKYQNGVNYKWSSNVTYDYTNANAKGNLAETIKNIVISISK